MKCTHSADISIKVALQHSTAVFLQELMLGVSHSLPLKKREINTLAVCLATTVELMDCSAHFLRYLVYLLRCTRTSFGIRDIIMSATSDLDN
jgi:hypothetical protein